MNEIDVQPGSSYRFAHRRKGSFVAEVLELVAGDENDPVLIKVRVNTSVGNGQERLANTVEYKDGKKVRPEFTEKLLRSSLIEGIVLHGKC